MKQTTSPGAIRKYAESAGVEFDAAKVGHQYSVDCWAPQGKLWKNHGTHFISLEGDGYYTAPRWQDTMDDLKAEVAAGFEDCDDPECDVCYPD